MKMSPKFSVLAALAILALGACCKNHEPAATASAVVAAAPPAASADKQATATNSAAINATKTGSAAANEIKVKAPAKPRERPTNKAACDACKGRWARHGLAAEESCVCRTADAGKVCRDGHECEGMCIADDNGFEPKTQGPPAKGYWRGRCSEWDTVFGCPRSIPQGASKRPPMEADDAADTLCID